MRRGTTFAFQTKGGKVKQARVLHVETLDVLSIESRAVTYAQLGRRGRVVAVATAVAPLASSQ